MFSPKDIEKATAGKVNLASMLETLERVGNKREDRKVPGEDMTI
jgi:hypothetical protein